MDRIYTQDLVSRVADRWEEKGVSGNPIKNHPRTWLAPVTVKPTCPYCSITS